MTAQRSTERTVAPKGARERTLDPPDTAAELAALFSDERVRVADPDSGRAVALTVREFRFLEGLQAAALARPLIEDMAAETADGADPDAPPTLAFVDLLGKHAGLWLDLTARACGREAAWLARLGDADGLALRDAMWSANGAFFLRRYVTLVKARRLATGSLFGSSASSTRSSAPATGAATATSPDA